MTPKTRAIMVNSPNNPTGAVYSEESIKGLAALLERKQAEHGTEIFIISLPKCMADIILSNDS